jgi:hypothetical protein
MKKLPKITTPIPECFAQATVAAFAKADRGKRKADPSDARKLWRQVRGLAALTSVGLIVSGCGPEFSDGGRVRGYAPADGATCYYAWANPAAELAPCPGDEGGATPTDKRDVADGLSLGPRFDVLRLEPGACYSYKPEDKPQTVGVVASDRCDFDDLIGIGAE